MPNVARLALVLLLILAPPARAQAQERATPAQLAAAREYVRRGWRTLTRSERDLLSAAIDPKFQSTLSAQQKAPPQSLRWPVYVARGENTVRRRLRARMTAEDFARVELRRLQEHASEATPGLLYLPRPYVVPAGVSKRDAEGRTHYERVKEFYRTHEVADYEVGRFYDRATDSLTPAFYKGDRSMRESGFDPSNRFGPFNADITSYNPVCLNSLLYVYERDAAEHL